MIPIQFNLIGAGKLGKNIGRALSKHHIGQLSSVYNLRFNHAIEACNFMGAGKAIEDIHSLSKADITWITCNDDAISSVVDQLHHASILKPNSLIIHCSGALSSSILKPLHDLGCSVASFHPLKAFRANYLSNNAFDQVECIIEGDDAACSWLISAFTGLNARLITLKPENKAAYHAGACMASNYLITLAHCAEQLFVQAGISKEGALEMIVKLMQGNLDNILETRSIINSLTGPLARGDIQTISLHLDSIKDAALTRFYKEAALATLKLKPSKQSAALKAMLGSSLK